MTRADFLVKTWKSYPKISGVEGEFLLGRIVKLEDQKAMVKRDQKIETIEWSCIELSEDGRLGASCPLNCLALGDVIAYHNIRPGIGVFYLLSPNLSQKKPKDVTTNLWPDYIRLVENFFADRGFYKARTPLLVSSPGVDHHIDFLEVKASQTGRSWTLPTSPEISLKKLLCQGYDKVFEIKTCFRDDLDSPQHKVEFEMLEWYRCYESLESLVSDISLIFMEIKSLFPSAFVNFNSSVSKTTVREQFKTHLNFELTPKTTRDDLLKLAKEQFLDFQDDDDWNTLFFRIYMEKIEPELGKNGPEVVFDYPASQASLAQINNDGWAERFELYWQGVELANAYLEVNSPAENEKIFNQENSLRIKEGKRSLVDEDFFNEMKKGMPPASGIALGLERLYWLLTRG